jgi:hypothetical protein
VIAHPLAYLRHRAAHLWTLLTGTNLTLELYHAGDPNRMPLVRNRYFQKLLAMHEKLAPTMLFKAGFWLILCFGAFAYAWPSRASPTGAFAIGATGSAIAYDMSYFFFGVASDFRYTYWCVLASLIGTVTAVLAGRERQASRTEAAALRRA